MYWDDWNEKDYVYAAQNILLRYTMDGFSQNTANRK